MYITFGGSRNLAQSFYPLVEHVTHAALDAGFSVRVGCARGADRFVVQAVLAACAADRLAIFAAGRGPASSLFARAAARGARVVSFAGGEQPIPIVARLALRSQRAARGCTVAVFFLASPGSPGSLKTAAYVVSQGSQVFAFCCGFPGQPSSLPGCVGFWSAAALAGIPCWQWHPSQKKLF